MGRRPCWCRCRRVLSPTLLFFLCPCVHARKQAAFAVHGQKPALGRRVVVPRSAASRRFQSRSRVANGQTRRNPNRITGAPTAPINQNQSGGSRQLGGREIPRAPAGTATRPRGPGLRVRRPPCLPRTGTAQGHSTTLTRTHLLCSYREPEPVEKPIRAARNKDARGRPRNERQRLNHLWWLLLSPLPSCPFPSSSDPPIPRPCASVS